MKKLKLSVNSPIILGFVLLCFLATLLGILTGQRSTHLLFMTWHSPLTSPLTYLRFFTHVFGHDGWDHFIGNASYLLLIGPLLEEKYGRRAILEVIAITALVTGLFNYWFFPNAGLCGASGVVFALILLSSFTGFREGEIPLTFILVTVIFLGQQVYEGIFLRDNVSNMAHLIGGVIGAALGFVLNGRRRSIFKRI